MPYLPADPNQEEQQKNQQGTSSGAPFNVSGSSNVISGSVNPGQASQTPGKSGAYANINQYLDANKDQSSQMGSTIAGTISGQGNTVRSDISNTQNDFGNLVQSGTISNLSGANKDSDSIVNQAMTGSADNQVSADQTSRFKDISTAQYQGPQDLSGSQYYSTTQSDLNKASQYQKDAQTDAGRFSILQQLFNSPTYSSGQQNLDNALILGNDQARTAIADAGNSLNGLSDTWTKAQTDAQTLATQTRADTDAARSYAQNLLTTGRTQRTGEVNKDLSNQQAHWGDQYDAFNNLLSNYHGGTLNLTQAQANALGLSGQSGQSLLNTLNGVAPTAYLNLQAFDPSKVVSKDEFAQLAALDQLGSQFGQSATSRFSDPSLAGTLSASNNFDGSNFGKAVSQAQDAFNKYAAATTMSADTGGLSDTMRWQGGLYRGAIDGNISSNANGTENIQAYLNGQGPAINSSTRWNEAPGVGYQGWGSPISQEAPYWRQMDSAINARNSQTVQQQLFSQILSALDQQGFNNKINIQG